MNPFQPRHIFQTFGNLLLAMRNFLATIEGRSERNRPFLRSMKYVTVTARHRFTLCLTLSFAMVASIGDGLAQDQRLIARTQEEQQRVRAMLRELLSGVLDLQLRQLQENGLSDQEIYRDVKTMRAHLDRLVNEEMTEVISQLRDLEQLTGHQREARFAEIRQQMRTVVRQISTEKHELLKRLKLVELAEQTRKLIHQQSAVQTDVRAIAGVPASRREELILTAIENQRDVKELFLQFQETLSDARMGTGPLAMAASDAIRLMTVAATASHLDAAQEQLRRADPLTTLQEQDRVITSWKQILPVLEQAQGTFQSELAASIELIRGLIQRQESLRVETRHIDHESVSSTLVERQSKLSPEISTLAAGLPTDSTISSLLQQAETAAMDAAAALLENQLSEGIANQGKVLGNLLSVFTTLQKQDRDNANDRSAEDLRMIVQSLLAAKQSVATLQQPLDSIDVETRTSLTQKIDVIAEALQRTANDPRMIKPIANGVSAANDSLARLRTHLAEQPMAEAIVRNQIQQSINDALAQISTAAEDAMNREAAVTIGELIRAAEVLERLAADERAVSRQLGRATSTSSIQQLADHQAEVLAVTEKLAQSLKSIAEDPAKQVANASESTIHLRQRLLSAVAHSSSLDHQSISDLTSTLAGELGQAARQLRAEIEGTSKKLASRTLDRATDVEAAKSDIERALEQHPHATGLVDMELARQQLRRALEQQLIAKGNTSAAMSLRISGAIEAAIRAQQTANEAASQFANKTGLERKAVTTQAEVVELIEKSLAFAERRPKIADENSLSANQISPLLQKALRTAAQSARSMLEGNSSDAQTARKSTTTLLGQSQELVQEELNRLIKESATSPSDQSAQSNALTASLEAQSSARRASGEAASNLDPVVEALRVAHAAFAFDQSERMSAQDQAIEQIQNADQKLKLLEEQLAAHLKSQLAEVGDELLSLSQRTTPIEPDASKLIEAAGRAAMGALGPKNSSHELTKAAGQSELALEQAAAELGAKVQRLRQDQSISESVTSLMQSQETAVQSIAEQSEVLEQGSSNESNSELQDAAAKLKRSQQDFAEALRAVGQAAVEISGQREVANRPLREALQLASNLSSPESTLADGTNSPANDSQPAEDPTTSENGSPSPQQAPSSASSDSTNDQREEGRGKPAAPGSSKGNKSNSLGTSFISNSPDLTAEMMAGAAAKRASERALQQQVPMSESSTGDPRDNSNQSSESQEGDPITSENSSSSRLSKRDGPATINQRVKNGAIERQRESTAASGAPSNQSRETEQGIGSRRLQEEAWHAKLPPELRKSIRAGVSQKPPRAYEERLKKYFQSVD